MAIQGPVGSNGPRFLGKDLDSALTCAFVVESTPGTITRLEVCSPRIYNRGVDMTGNQGGSKMDKFIIDVSDAFVEMCYPALEDARGYTAYSSSHPDPVDEFLVHLEEVDSALSAPVKTGKGWTRIELNEAGLEALRQEATFRVEWASDEAFAEFGDEALVWHGKARVAKSMLKKIATVKS